MFYAALLFEKRRGFNKVAWIPLFDTNRAHSSQRLSLHSLCNRMVRVRQTHGYFHARHTCDMCLLPEGINFLVGDGVAMSGIVCAVERCLSPPANNKRFCAEHIANEELCAVVRHSTTLGPCGAPHARRPPRATGQTRWLVCARHIWLEERHDRRAGSAATRRNGSVPANDVADARDAIDGAEGDQFGASSSTGMRVVWCRQHVQRYEVFSRPCGVVVFSAFLEGGEGPATVLASMAKAIRCLEYRPSVVAYDMCCRIFQHVRGPNVEESHASAVDGVVLVVPRFHERTHVSCGPLCISSCRMFCYPALLLVDGKTSRFNPSRAEQHFRCLRGWQLIVHAMHCDKAAFMLGCVEEERNFFLLRRRLS